MDRDPKVGDEVYAMVVRNGITIPIVGRIVQRMTEPVGAYEIQLAGTKRYLVISKFHFRRSATLVVAEAQALNLPILLGPPTSTYTYAASVAAPAIIPPSLPPVALAD